MKITRASKHVLLLYPNRENRKIGVVAPRGLEIIASFLEDLPVNISILNPYLSTSPKKALHDVLADRPPMLIGISIRNIDDCLTVWNGLISTKGGIQVEQHLVDARNVIREIKKAGAKCPVIIGGAGFSGMPLQCLDYLDVDYGVVGPGEVAFRRIVELGLRRAYSEHELQFVPGVITRASRLKRASKKARTSGYIGAVPRSEASQYRYLSSEMAVRTSVGCSMSCAHCMEGASYVDVQIRSPKSMLEELKYISENREHIRSIFIADSEFNLPDEKRAIQTCRMIIKERLNERFRFWAYIHPKPACGELLAVMREANVQPSFTVDHINDRILQLMGKNFNRRDVDRLFMSCRRQKINVWAGFIFGYPSESRQTLDEAIAYMKGAGNPETDIFMYSAGVRIYPGTGLALMIDPQSPHIYGQQDDSFVLPVVYSEPYSPLEMFRHIQSSSRKHRHIKPMNALPQLAKHRWSKTEKEFGRYIHGANCRALNRHDEAIHHFHQIRSIRGQEELYIKSRIQLAEIYCGNGDYRMAERMVKEAGKALHLFDIFHDIKIADDFLALMRQRIREVRNGARAEKKTGLLDSFEGFLVARV